MLINCCVIKIYAKSLFIKQTDILQLQWLATQTDANFSGCELWINLTLNYMQLLWEIDYNSQFS